MNFFINIYFIKFDKIMEYDLLNEILTSTVGKICGPSVPQKKNMVAEDQSITSK